MSEYNPNLEDKNTSADALHYGAGEVRPEPVDIPVEQGKQDVEETPRQQEWRKPHVETFVNQAGNVAIRAFDTEPGELPHVSPDLYRSED